jgi:endoribonuclease Dicer
MHDYISVLQGKAMQTKKLAKRAAALETCIKLYEMGELSEHLLPRDRQETLLTCPELFLLFREEEMEDGPPPGTRKRKRAYRKEVSSLSDLLRAVSSVSP